MSTFSTLFADAFECLAGVSGEAVVYKTAAAVETPVPAAIVGNERVEERQLKAGLVKVRVREFSLQRSVVDAPLLNAQVVYGGEDWPIKDIAARDLTYTRVRCELHQLREGSKGNYKPTI